MNIDPIRPYLDLIKWGGIALGVLLVFAFGWNRGADRWEGKYDNEVAAHKADNDSHKAVIDNLAALTQAAANKARAASEQAKADRKTNDQRFKDAEHEADKAKRDLAAALRRGDVRLRDEWACPAPGTAQGGDTGTASGQDANAGLRATREGAILDDIADHDEADNWIGWLQAEVISTRKACGVTP